LVHEYRGASLIRKRPLPKETTVALYLGPYGGPRGWAFFQGARYPVLFSWKVVRKEGAVLPLNPKPQTPNPKSQILNPKHQTSNPKL